jgi:hypothetical protein
VLRATHGQEEAVQREGRAMRGGAG